VPFRDIAEVIGRQLKLPAVSVTAQEATDHFSFLAPDALTRERLGWVPTYPTLSI
jgi:hypothetical protein